MKPVSRYIGTFISATCVSLSATLAVAQDKQSNQWEPPPLPVRQMVEAFSALTLGQLQKMDEYHLSQLRDAARASLEIIMLEQHRRAERAAHFGNFTRPKPLDAKGKGMWVPDDPTPASQRGVYDNYTDSGLTYGR